MKQTYVNHAVANQFERYCRIQTATKKIDNPVFFLHQTPTHPAHQSGDQPIAFESGVESGHLAVNLNCEKTKSFKFRLHCDAFMPMPCYRFDSDGAAHENPADDNVPLRQRTVPTPHFHRFDHKGRNVAYRPESLQEKEQEILASPVSALQLFCAEENISLPVPPSFIQETLPLGVDSFEDPLEGVDFP